MCVTESFLIRDSDKLADGAPQIRKPVPFHENPDISGISSRAGASRLDRDLRHEGKYHLKKMMQFIV